MSRRLKKRHWLLLVLVIIAPFAVFLFGKWLEAGRNGGQKFAEPFRIAGNLYYVGANDVTSFLITGPEGHVLIDGGYPGTAKLILASIAKLGFNIRDVKVLLNSEQHFDHAGGLAELQQASGAKLYASEASADVIANGGDDETLMLPMRVFTLTGIARYRAPRVDRRLKDGDPVRVGPIELTANLTPGHTHGCTSWSFPVIEGDRKLLAVHACSLKAMGGMSYPGYEADFDRTFRKLRSLPADVWMTAHAREFGRYRKFLLRGKGQNPFIDPQGYRAHIDSNEAAFKRGVRH